MYRKILVPVDLGHPDVAARILGIAAKLGQGDSVVTVLHVVPEIPVYAEAYVPTTVRDGQVTEIRKALDQLVADAGLSRAETLITSGAAHVEILDQIEASEPDLVIIGSHRPGIADYFLGSTAARVVRHAPCSVLVDR